MSIITIGGIKGGTGKTTIATNLSIIRQLENHEVLLIDGDDQGSAMDFSSVRTQVKGSTGYTIVRLTGSTIREQGLMLSAKYTDTIIDVGGRDTSSQRAALIISDIALFPFNPRSFDIWTLSKVIALLDECRVVNPKLKAMSFLNKADSMGNDNSDAANELRDAQGLTYIDCPIKLRKIFANAASDGSSVIEQKPADKKAIEEMKTLYKHVFNN